MFLPLLQQISWLNPLDFTKFGLLSEGKFEVVLPHNESEKKALANLCGPNGGVVRSEISPNSIFTERECG